MKYDSNCATADAGGSSPSSGRIQHLRRRLPQLPHSGNHLRSLALTRIPNQSPRLSIAHQARLLRKPHHVAVIRHQLFRPRVPKSPVQRIHKVQRRMTANKLKGAIFRSLDLAPFADPFATANL